MSRTLLYYTSIAIVEEEWEKDGDLGACLQKNFSWARSLEHRNTRLLNV